MRPHEEKLDDRQQHLAVLTEPEVEEDFGDEEDHGDRALPPQQHAAGRAPNVLARRFAVTAPNTVWVSDLTYLWTGEGWLYLLVILDLFSRRVIGWAVGDRMTRQLALDALALAHRAPPEYPGT